MPGYRWIDATGVCALSDKAHREGGVEARPGATRANSLRGLAGDPQRITVERMERSVEVLAIILFGVTGLSHIVQPKAWVEFFILLREKGKPGAFVDGLLNLPVAGIIIAFHNVWSGVPMVLTIVGWCLLIKSLLRLCLPQQGLRLMMRMTVQRSWEVQIAGAGLIGIAGMVGYGVYAAR